MKKIVQQDMDRIYSGLTEAERTRFQDSTILFTGGAGFLGFYFITFLTHFQQELGVKQVICLLSSRKQIRSVFRKTFCWYRDVRLLY